jgi:predicted TIM-barrel fold metal-dependent hydrolase
MDKRSAGDMAEIQRLSIVDPHIHLWDISTGLYPQRAARGEAKTSASGDYLLDDLLADAGPIQIVKAVHVEAFPLDGLAEARHVQAMPACGPDGPVKGIVAHADLSQPDVDSALSALTDLSHVRGIRDALNVWVERPGTVQRDFLSDVDWWRGFGRLSAHGLSFDLQVRPDQLLEAASRLADQPQDTLVVLNHMGCFGIESMAQWQQWRAGLRALGARPNVWVKLSGPGMYDPAPTLQSVRPSVYECLEAFGPERAMFASNFPVDKRAIGYAELWAIFAAAVEDLPKAQQDALMRGNAERFYRI